MNETTLEDLFEVEFSRSVSVTVPDPDGKLVPEQKFHEFKAADVKLLFMWDRGATKKNVLLLGPTGSGKSSLVEQYAARMHREVFRIACHGRMEFAELVGRPTIRNGQEVWLDGPLVMAMKRGSILLMDEFNFLPPQVVGGLNSVLDGGALLVPDTGEVIQPHPAFRIAATGNAVNDGDDAPAYRGVVRQSSALLDRFISIQVNYMDELEEAKVVHSSAPNLSGSLVQAMISLAKDVRSAHASGEMSSPLSTRVLCTWAGLMEKMMGGKTEAAALEEATMTLGYAFFNRMPPMEARAVETLLKKIWVGGA